MTRVIKVNQSDIKKIVMEVAYGNEFDDFDTKIQPEELPQEPEMTNDMDTENEPKVPKFLIGKTENGKIAVTNTKTGQIYSK